MGETLIGVEGKEAGTGKGCKKGYGKAGQCEEDGFPVVPDGAVEAGAIEEQGFPDDDDGEKAGYLAYQYARKTPQGAGDKRDRDVDEALHPCLLAAAAVASFTCLHLNALIWLQRYPDYFRYTACFVKNLTIRRTHRRETSLKQI